MDLAQALHELFPPALPAPTAGALTPSPYSFEFTGEDNLRLTVNNSQTAVRVTVNYRVHQAANRSHASSFTFAPTADRAANVFEFGIGDGYLLNVSMFASSGTPKRGQTFARLQVIRGSGTSAIVLGTIAQGYVTAGRDLAWPGSPLENSTDGEGYLRTFTGTAFPAGNECVESVPTGARWEVLAVRLVLTASGAAGNRTPALTFDNGVSRYFWCPSPVALAPSATGQFFWGQGMPVIAASGPNFFQSTILRQAPLTAGFRLASNTVNLDAADVYIAPLVIVREWLEV